MIHAGNSTESSSNSDNDSTARKVAAAFVMTQARTLAKHRVSSAFYTTAYKQRHHIRKLVNDRWAWISYRAARRRLSKSLPTITIHHYFQSKGTGEIKLVIDKKLPEKKYLQSNKYELKATWSRIKIADALAAHDKLHKNQNNQRKGNNARSWKKAGKPPVEIILSMDGIPIDGSSGLHLEVLSFKLDECNQVYPIGVHIGTAKEKNLSRIFDAIIEELKDLNVRVTRVIADSPQRTTLLNMDSVSAYFGCSQCYARGVQNTDKKANGDKKGAAVIWPLETLWQPPRTMQKWIEDIAAAQENKQNGIKGDTPLRKLVDDLISQVPLDVFHVVYLGLVKRIIKQVLRIKDTGATGIMKEVKAKVDKDMKDKTSIQYPSDFSRRPRPINLPVYKSSEWRNLATAAFYLLTTAFEDFHQAAANKLWGHFVFLVKAFLLPNSLYSELENNCNLKAIMTNFYKLYMRVCNKRSCAPNVHMFHHLLTARKRLEFSQMSTEPFESAYAILKRSYHVGTKSQGKQMLERVYTLIIGQADRHSCRPKYRIRPKTKARYNDSLIATKNHRFYQVQGKLVTGNYACKRLVIGRFDYPHAPTLPFQKLWTHKYLGELPALREISPNDVIGKAVICRDVITLLPHGAIFG